jgi:hypothetical protein
MVLRTEENTVKKFPIKTPTVEAYHHTQIFNYLSVQNYDIVKEKGGPGITLH